MATKWTEKSLQEEALKYETKIDFRKGSRGAYSTAHNRGVLSDICTHMQPKHKSWSRVAVVKEAKKYSTRIAFQEGSKDAYLAAYRRKILDEACAHMECLRTDWTDEDIIKEASRYAFRDEFNKKNPNAYSAASKRGILAAACAHMKYLRTPWTDDALFVEAARYSVRDDFRKGSPGAYSVATKRGLLGSVCSHMEDRRPSDNDAIYLWQVKGERWMGRHVYKVGVTSFRLGKERIRRVAKKSGFSPIIIRLVQVNGKATELEAQLLELGQHPGYTGFDGCTEFRALTEDELDLAIEVIDFCEETGETTAVTEPDESRNADA